MNEALPSWSSVTREERYFSSTLFHELVRNPKPFWRLLSKQLSAKLDVRNIGVADVGYEVCFFRDLARVGMVERQQRSLEKQTFDLVLTLESGPLVIVEVKAQQAFNLKQLEKLREARNLIIASKKLPSRHRSVFIAGLCSSRARCDRSRPLLDGLIRWSDLRPYYPKIAADLARADGLYQN